MAIASVNVRAWRAAYRGLIPDGFLNNLDPEQSAASWRETLSNPQADVLVVGDERQAVLGFGLLARSRDADTGPDVGEIVAMYVDPERWRSRLGSALMIEMLRAASVRGFSEVTLWVLVENSRARAFYESSGFVPDATEKSEEKWGGVAREIRYRRGVERRAEAKLRAAVQKPDFSGEWILNVQASDLSPVVAPAVESGFVRIRHREPVVSVHLQITMSGKPFDVRFERPSNWDGDALAFVDTQPTPNGEMTIAFRYELQDSGRRLRAAEALRGAGWEQDNVWVFDNADVLRAHTPSPPEPLGTMRVSLGTVKWWREAKGYGVIGVKELVPWDVWCHFSAIVGDGFRTLTEGEAVEVEYYRADQESFKYVARSARRISRP